MSWYVCFAASIVILAVAARLVFWKRMGRTRIVYGLFGCLLVAYLLYVPPFLAQYEMPAALLGCLINTMQVISLDADYLFFYDLILGELGAGLFTKIYFIFLAVIHVMLPAVSAMTAVTLVVRCFAEMQLKLLKRKKRPLHVFSQANYKSMLLARDIYAKDAKCDLLFLGEEATADFADLQQDLHCTMLNDQIEDIKARAERRKVYYYCISEDQDENLKSALTIVSNLQGKQRTEQENNHVILFTSDRSAELLVDSIPKGFVNLSIVDEERTDAYHLLQRYPLLRYAKDRQIHVLICGFAGIGEAFLRAAAWCGQLHGYRLRFSVAGKDIEDQASDFQTAFPGLFTDRYDIRFYSYHTEKDLHDLLAGHCSDANYIVTAYESEKENVEKAVFLRRFFYRLDGEFCNAPPIFTYIDNVEKAAAVAALTTAEARADRRMSYDITPFGVATDLYTFESVTESELEVLSKNVHLVYEDIFSETDIDVEAALERYNLFEVNKSSNRANALHIRYKLAMLGLDYTDDPDAREVDLADYLNPETLEDLTRAEHDRWMAFLESEGWEASTVEEVKRYQQAGLSKGRHNCPILKLHPYICPFDDLAECSDRLGLPDSTVYDRELIARIPDILHDKWQISGKKYKIIKLNSEQGG